ncbi:hypothetical protein GCM10023321_82220 [Pseudonocardia eucalypti]|uniref:HTH merR-type domain-containing protein n=1 Tax=Pseudonocardia eucalypti TaxID=648755 RepID=A0ABP9REV6_9PSEU|nr:DNA-binding transcriptional MerR regulator [Pseudonocardia eucalypti]
MLIGELARAAGTTPRAIRYYEQQGLLDACRASNGYRAYGPDAVRQVRNIRWLLAMGFTSDEVRDFVPCLKNDLESEGLCAEGAAAVVKKIAALDEEIAARTAVRDRLAAALRDTTARVG